FRRPPPELLATMRAVAVPDGEDAVEVVMIDEPRNLPLALDLNYSEFPNGCRGVEFLLVEDVSQVLVDRGHGDLVQSPEKTLREPDSPAVQAYRTWMRLLPSSPW